MTPASVAGACKDRGGLFDMEEKHRKLRRSGAFLIVLVCAAFCLKIASGQTPLLQNDFARPNAPILEGRVVVQMPAGRRTVCSDGFDLNDATTICRNLNLPTESVSIVTKAWIPYLSGPWTASPTQSAVAPDLTWLCLFSLNLGDCTKYNQVGVKCFHTDWTLRLMNGEVNATAGVSGRVEVFVDGDWGTISDAGFGQKEAAVVCRQLGKPFAGARVLYGNHAFGQGASRPRLIRTLRCNGTESNIANCARSAPPESVLDDSSSVAVQCFPYDYSLRLRTTSDTPSAIPEGRLEVFRAAAGTWGSVCIDGFSQANVITLCGQLGFPTSPDLGPTFYTATAPSNTPTLISQLRCTGSEVSVIGCMRSETSHSTACQALTNAVGLRCYNHTTIPISFPQRGVCEDPWLSSLSVTPAPGTTTMLIGTLASGKGQYKSQDVLLVSYRTDGTLVGHVALSSPFQSVFGSDNTVYFGSVPRPQALVLADVDGNGRDDLIALYPGSVMVSTASGTSSFTLLTSWAEDPDARFDPSNTTTRVHIFADVTGDGAADMVFFDQATLRLAYMASSRTSAFIDDVDGDGVTWYELASIGGRCSSLGEDCFVLSTDFDADGTTDIVVMYINRLTPEEEVFNTFVAFSPPAPLRWQLSAPVAFPRGACTSPLEVLPGNFIGIACISSYGNTIYLSGQGVWGSLPSSTVGYSKIVVRDVNQDGRDDLVVFAESSYYMLSTGSGFEDPISTAMRSNPSSVSLNDPATISLGETDTTAGTVVAAASAISQAPIELRCGPPSRVVAYVSNTKRDAAAACQGDSATGGTVVQRAATATHVVFSFVIPNAEGLNLTLRGEGDVAVLANLPEQVKAVNPGAQVLLAVGGSADADFNFNNIVLGEQSRDVFAEAVASFVDAYRYDGAELDWPSVNTNQTTVYAELLTALFLALNARGKVLTVAISPNPVFLGMPWEVLANVVEYFHLKAFDLGGDEVLGSAPYVESPLYDCLEATGMSVNTMLDTLLAGGLPPQRVTVVFPSMGRSYLLDSDGFVAGPALGGPCMGREGLLDQAELRELIAPSSAVFNGESFVLSAHYGDNLWTHFDSEHTVGAKICFARLHCLGGMGLWDVDSDSFGDLLRRMTSELQGDPALCNTFTPPRCTNTMSAIGSTDLGDPVLVSSLGNYEYELYEAHCTSLGGHLASVTSSAESSVIYSLISGWADSGQLTSDEVYRGRDVFLWLGASDAAQEGRFIWSDDGSDLAYRNWAPGQPDGRYGGEDCVATSVTLEDSAGAGLREVVSENSKWSDLGCTVALPFVCKKFRSLGSGVPIPTRVPLVNTALMVFPPRPDGSQLLMTHAEASKLCRTLGAEIPSLTDLYVAEALVQGNIPGLPDVYWLGLRSFGDGQMYWSDGSISSESALTSWSAEDFGEAHCGMMVNEDGSNVTLAMGVHGFWNGSFEAYRLASPPPPSPPSPEPPSPNPPPPPRPSPPSPAPRPPSTAPDAPAPPGFPFPPDVPLYSPPPPNAPRAPPSEGVILEGGMYSVSCLEKLPVVCQEEMPDLNLYPDVYCIARPNGFAFMVPGELIGDGPLLANRESDCIAACMVQPACVYYTYIPGYQDATYDMSDAAACFIMAKPWRAGPNAFTPITTPNVDSPGIRTCFRSLAMFVTGAMPLPKDDDDAMTSAPPQLALSPIFGWPSPPAPPSAPPPSPFSLACRIESAAPILTGITLVLDTNSSNILDVGVVCGGLYPGLEQRLWGVPVPTTGERTWAEADCGVGDGVVGISGTFDVAGICSLTVSCLNGKNLQLVPEPRACPQPSVFGYQCPDGLAASGLMAPLRDRTGAECAAAAAAAATPISSSATSPATVPTSAVPSSAAAVSATALDAAVSCATFTAATTTSLPTATVSSAAVSPAPPATPATPAVPAAPSAAASLSASPPTSAAPRTTATVTSHFAVASLSRTSFTGATLAIPACSCATTTVASAIAPSTGPSVSPAFPPAAITSPACPPISFSSPAVSTIAPAALAVAAFSLTPISSPEPAVSSAAVSLSALS
ncbi:hypothetical protein HYH03_011482 [Edaphochlamys debaryana]|uniref:Chitinase n=1 Tax=Edaphochlamys debaryana TaxID=47281 RepID=A0A836BVG2_9CHLO|nr:hypothetical protein HYH03_011482 [Edaphochlamys debaryana]|eukprot:KAG2490017.1 hypothetical protein HYH03_011482 [Edaphochlamys debaryana]